MNRKNRQQSNKRSVKLRRAAILSEALVSAAILAAGIGILAKSQYNLRRLWSDTGHFQLATDELCNQLDRLTRLPKDQLPELLGDLKANDAIAARLPNCRIQGKLIEDSLGPRIQLSIDWKRVGIGKPLELIGWLKPGDTVAKEQSPSDTTPSENGDTVAPSSTDAGAKP